jgi:hypothetical protein
MKQLVEFVQVYRLYRRHHSVAYALRLARDIAFYGLPF